MVFGDPDKFALVLVPEFLVDTSVYGSVSAYVGSKQIGDPDSPAMLGIMIASLKRSLKYCSHRGVPINPESMEEIWEVLYKEAFRGREDEDDETPSRVAAAHRFVVLTNFSESFDGFACFLVELDDSEILLWKGDDRDSAVDHVRLGQGYYRTVVEDVLRSNWQVPAA